METDGTFEKSRAKSELHEDQQYGERDASQRNQQAQGLVA
jgi:hypothetical protein